MESVSVLEKELLWSQVCSKVSDVSEITSHGAQRFLELVDLGYYTDIALFRHNNWIIQFGAIQTPSTDDVAAVREPWMRLIEPGRHHLPAIPDDPKTDCGGECTKGSLFDWSLSYAGGGLNSRTAQIFVVHHRGKSQPLGESPWETPFARLVDGISVVKAWYSGYGEKVDQIKIFQYGTKYTRATFPKLDYILSCSLESESSKYPVESTSDNVVIAELLSSTESTVLRDNSESGTFFLGLAFFCIVVAVFNMNYKRSRKRAH